MSTATVPQGSGAHGPSSRWAVMLGALGVVYGDIGTSPLYAMKECFSKESPHHIEASSANVLGILSLIFWSLALVVTVKYLVFIMRADNEGKGGILALLALLPQKGIGVAHGALVLIVLFGASLLCGEGVITPAISVLSAVEGLEIATSKLRPLILPITCGILVGLFSIQKRGTGRVGAVFGPLTLLWFVMIASLGIAQLVRDPSVLWAIDPRHAVRFFLSNGKHGFLMLGGVVLAITGVEALYADMGHFGLGPIRVTWLAVVWPSLILNYFGQGALLIANPEVAKSTFYALVPSWGLYPAVAIATAATVVASQALISGVFSLTQQAVQLGFFPRVTIIHTSKDTEGQIYIPEVNWGLFVACIALVLTFRSSTALAAAYGIAVTGTMSITSIVYFVVVTNAWKWPLWRAVPLLLLFLAVDLSFFTANAAKFFDGGWFPIAMGSALFVIMTTWKRGRAELAVQFQKAVLALDVFLEDVTRINPPRVAGTAVFMASNPKGTPTVLLHHFKHNKVLHKQVVLLSVVIEQVPEVPVERRVKVEPLGQGFFRIVVSYGFMQQPNVPEALEMCQAEGLAIELRDTSYYLGRETLLATGRSGMMRWRKALFAFVSRNARPATAYFRLPPGRVVELGMQIDL